LRDPAFVDWLCHIHSSHFVTFIPHGEAGTSTTGSSCTGRFPFFVLEGVDQSTAFSPCLVVG
jgi:hypothetical protein